MDERGEPVSSKFTWHLLVILTAVSNRWSAALPSVLGSRLILNMRETVENQRLSSSYILEQFSSDPPTQDPDMELAVRVAVSTDTSTTLDARIPYY